MSIKFSQLQCKEVICVGSGQRLGFVSDICIDEGEGRICALVVPCPGRLLPLPGRGEDYIIPWSAICRIGPDIVLVDIQPDSCRNLRPRKGFL